MDVGRLLAANFPEENGFFEAGNLLRGKLGELVVGVLEELGEKEGGAGHDDRKVDRLIENYPE